MSKLERRIITDPPYLEIVEGEDGWIEIIIYGAPGSRGAKGIRKGSVKCSRQEFVDLLEKFWPGEVAGQFKERNV